MLRRPNSTIIAVRALVLAFVLFAPTAGRSQSARTTGVDVQQFRPGPGASDYLGVLGGFVGPHFSLAGGVTFNLADAPLLTERSGRGDKVTLLDQQGTFDLLLSISAWGHLELGVALPIDFPMEAGPGFDVTPGLTRPSGGAGLGDLRLTPKVGVVAIGRTFGLALAAPMSLPTGSDFAGYGAFSIQPTLVLDFVPADYFRLTLNGGVRFRPERTLADLELGREVVWGLGMKFSFLAGDQPLAVVGSFSGAFPLPAVDAQDPPFDFLAGLEWRGIPNLTVTAAVGAGITRGYGSPDLRTMLGVRYSAWSDCVYGPEDYDGFEDDDDCADIDNDGDGLLDEVDRCPNEAETKNGFDDDDGCPDQLPDFARLGDAGADAAYESTSADADNDGIVDALDACPTEAEDYDGFLDGDGCPEPDNDGDGLLDGADRCPDVAETNNGFEDDDGCPDDAPTRAKVDDATRKIDILEKVYFATGKAVIRDRSFPLLDEIARILKSRKDIARIQVSGYTDSLGSDATNLRLSRRRAEAVREGLIARGVAGDRVVAKGFGEASPLADNRTEAGREQNRRVEFDILDYGETPPATP